MKCSRCGAEMKIKNVKIDTDIYGNPIYNKYAYCYNCKIKRNLGQQKGAAKGRRRRLSTRRAAKQRKRKFFLIALLILLLAAAVGAGFFYFQNNKKNPKTEENTVVMETKKNKISSGAFSKLETGMTLKEVLDIIGNDGNKLMQTASEESTLERYQWIADKGNGTVILTFQDEKLISISQTDMVDTKHGALSTETSKNIKFDTSYEDVVTELGSEGPLISETIADGSVNSIYTWTDNDSDIKLTVVFKDGKVQSAN